MHRCRVRLGVFDIVRRAGWCDWLRWRSSVLSRPPDRARCHLARLNLRIPPGHRFHRAWREAFPPLPVVGKLSLADGAGDPSLSALFHLRRWKRSPWLRFAWCRRGRICRTRWRRCRGRHRSSCGSPWLHCGGRRIPEHAEWLKRVGLVQVCSVPAALVVVTSPREFRPR